MMWIHNNNNKTATCAGSSMGIVNGIGEDQLYYINMVSLLLHTVLKFVNNRTDYVIGMS